MRLIVTGFLLGGLLACQARETPLGVLPAGKSSTSESSVELSVDKPAQSGMAIASQVQTLNLSLPPMPVNSDGTEWLDDKPYYQVAEWFKGSSKAVESRLKIKSKLLLKEQSEFKGSVSAYAENVSGAEVGFEYKTR
jgi:hypothetical protein